MLNNLLTNYFLAETLGYDVISIIVLLTTFYTFTEAIKMFYNNIYPGLDALIFCSNTIQYTPDVERGLNDMIINNRLKLLSHNYDVNDEGREINNKIHYSISTGNHVCLYNGVIFKLKIYNNSDSDLKMKMKLKMKTLMIFNKFLDQFTEELINFDIPKNMKKINIFKPIILPEGPINWTLYCQKNGTPLSSVYINEDLKESLVDEVKWFFKSRDWYIKKCLPRRRGYLLHGPTGSGKSSLVTSICTELNLKIYWVQLTNNRLNDERLMAVLNSVPQDHIILIEDIDAVLEQSIVSDKTINHPKINNTNPFINEYKERVDKIKNKFNLKKSTSITFQGLLNALDGPVAHTDHIIFFRSSCRSPSTSARS